VFENADNAENGRALTDSCLYSMAFALAKPLLGTTKKRGHSLAF
jgi:hypothetical protein